MSSNSESSVRNAQAEAAALVGTEFDARVLEPSPPAIDDGEWCADDPPAPGSKGLPTLSPAGMGGPDWESWLADHPGESAWVALRWLAGPRRLPTIPADLVASRLALHRLAAYVIAPVRHAANGKFGLRFTLGGFGTPFFGDDRQVRVEGGNLVDQRGDQVRSTPITSLAAAAEFLSASIDTETAAEHDSPEVGDINTDLGIDEDSARFLGSWFGMAFAALERVRADSGSVNPSRPQLWPGHFDPAIEVGDDDHRGSYGASPGDDAIPEPYLYMSIWWPDKVGVTSGDPAWNAPSFTGSILRLSDFGDVVGEGAAVDPVEVATRFWLDARDRLG